jgi:hypothetical protein
MTYRKLQSISLRWPLYFGLVGAALLVGACGEGSGDNEDLSSDEDGTGGTEPGDGDGSGGTEPGDGDGSGGTEPGDGDGDGLPPYYAGECVPWGTLWLDRPLEADREAEQVAFAFSNCYDYEDPQPDKPDMAQAADWIQFVVSDGMAAGEPFAISWNGIASEASKEVEIWALEESCGARRELLFEGELQLDVSCVTLTPSQQTEFILVVFADSPGYDDFLAMTYCPGGSCPQ